jgi:alpha-tubulin suppressor-like RCC1 family protein
MSSDRYFSLGRPRLGAPSRLGLAVACGLLALACGQDEYSPAEPDPAPGIASAATAAGPLAFRQVSAGLEHTCGVTTADVGYCWGDNRTGQLGNGTLDASTRPVPESGGLRFEQIMTGLNFSCGITTDDVAYCWGSNVFGQLGDGTSGTNRLTPVTVVGGRRFAHIRAGNNHTCAITPSGTGFCWGANFYGQLGDNTKIQRNAPEPVQGGNLLYRQIHPAERHTCALATNDRAYCWGLNEDGQLGDGSTVQKLKPAPVAGGLRFRQVIAGGAGRSGFHSMSCGVATTARSYCWGDNTNGQLGDGTKLRRTVPTLVRGAHDFLELSANGLNACGATRDAAVYCWGFNGYGQLGDGTFADRSRPTRIVGTRAFRRVDVGHFHTCAVTPTGRAFCWGSNIFGELGKGTSGDNTPTPVAVLGPS